MRNNARLTAVAAGDDGNLEATPEAVVAMAEQIERLAVEKVTDIQRITQATVILAINSAIEASRAGTAGLGFKVLAAEVKSLAGEVGAISEAMKSDVTGSLGALQRLGRRMSREVRGQRFVDLSLNAVELIDRNLYERTCDVRWWATDSAVVEALATPSPETAGHASARLGVILSAYTVYLDLWICDSRGVVRATGRRDRFPRALGADVSSHAWFREAMATRSGDDFAVADIASEPLLGGARIATYSAAIRRAGEARGEPLGVLGVHFDWAPQAQAIVDGVRLMPEERGNTCVMLVDARNRVIACSRSDGAPPETVPKEAVEGESGVWIDPSGVLWAHHLTPGYETYRGLGWNGVIAQRR